ncbi:2,3-bisphosphoglycerate-independent phosphoglycerate mutase [Parvicella tangerina]|uniref:2,3-bisphosphoglycerate-independent phosphoglycerate mutase n=1 Tax=Parvicella tangerina TaxID=2829795 RepID=A0A916NEU1_9FLAO|nr:2,3-bisphosphoglycerate-independent phosphoglycerate mutase [Parvicella tangerina]CAG5087531.1 2,3-bisphosphoglycerate-independent phosphoglycerate mutase [Parvicella tangerina]
MSKKVALVILDGWGHGKKDDSDGIFRAKTPFVDGLYEKYASSNLKTFGEYVGLPEGQMGNSEVGHMNIGAGRVVYQDLVKINKEIESGKFFKNEELLKAAGYAKKEGKKVHLLGLVSNGGVHSSQDHLHALCDFFEEQGLERVFVHAFTDGRDCSPTSGKGFLTNLESHIADKHTKIASVIGRYFAMDRDTRWERIKKAYDLMTKGVGKDFEEASTALQESYEHGVTDEFIEPHIHRSREGLIENDDVVICFNFRTDRCREITRALHQEDFPEFEMKKMPLYYVTMTNYDKTFKEVRVIFDKEELKNTLGEVVSDTGKTQLRIAETEKYPHVSFFFSGGREAAFPGENRIMINSPKVATYDLQPEMSAYEVTKAVKTEMLTNAPDFICLNFANGDMVGHTGVPEAIIKACETVDACLKDVVETGLDQGYSFVVIADHGNADKMFNEDGSPHTAHTTNLVPCILVDEEQRSLRDGILADVAPTILDLMGIDTPQEMSGSTLIQ